MIKQNLGYIISGIIILICIVIIYQKFSYSQKLLNDTSSTNTIRKEEDIKPQKNSEITIKKHIIQKGDTLWDLSVKYYGDGAKYKEIIKKNPGKTFKFKDGREGLIYPGTELEI
jgi:nucleoid-associated protein YgaU